MILINSQIFASTVFIIRGKNSAEQRGREPLDAPLATSSFDCASPATPRTLPQGDDAAPHSIATICSLRRGGESSRETLLAALRRSVARVVQQASNADMEQRRGLRAASEPCCSVRAAPAAAGRPQTDVKGCLQPVALQRLANTAQIPPKDGSSCNVDSYRTRCSAAKRDANGPFDGAFQLARGSVRDEVRRHSSASRERAPSNGMPASRRRMRVERAVVCRRRADHLCMTPGAVGRTSCETRTQKSARRKKIFRRTNFRQNSPSDTHFSRRSTMRSRFPAVQSNDSARADRSARMIERCPCVAGRRGAGNDPRARKRCRWNVFPA